MEPEMVAQLKVAELKEELKKRGLPLKGLKAELAERLLEAVRKEAVQHDEPPEAVAAEAGASVQEDPSRVDDDLAKPEIDSEKVAAPALPADQMDTAEANVEVAGQDVATEVLLNTKEGDVVVAVEVQEREPAETGGAVERLAPKDALIADRQDDTAVLQVEDGPQGGGNSDQKDVLPAAGKYTSDVKEDGGGLAQESLPDAAPAEHSPKPHASQLELDAEVVAMETENKVEPVSALEDGDVNRKGEKETINEISKSKDGPEVVAHAGKEVKAAGQDGKGKTAERKEQARTVEKEKVAERRRESGAKRAKEGDGSAQNGGETDGRPAKLLKADGSQGERTHVKTPSGRSEALAEKQAKPVEAEKSSRLADKAPTAPTVRSSEKSNGGVERKRDVPASARPATCSVRVNNLVRPFTERALRALLSETGTIEENGFWMDSIKTHCYVTFKSVDEATRTREALFNLRWPAQNPKLLAVSFVPQSEVESVVKGTPVAPSPNPAAGATIRGGAKDAVAVAAKEALNQRVVLPVKERLTRPAAEKPTPAAAVPEPAALSLDDLFRKTTAKPCIYWLPLTDEQVKQRTVENASSAKGKAS